MPALQLRLDIHDGPLQQLAALRAELHRLRSEAVATPRPEPFLEQIETIDSRLAATVDELRSLVVSEAEPPEQPLTDATLGVADLYADSLEIELDLRLPLEAEAELTAPQRVGLERVVQSALANVSQHSGAERAWIELAATPAGLLLEVADDGCGFDLDEALVRGARDGRLGLSGMSERVRLLGGHLSIETCCGGPTRVRVFLPLRAAVDEQPRRVVGL